MAAMRWRYLAAVGWLAVAAFAFSQFLANEFPMMPNDLGPPAIALAAAVLIAIGGRLGLVTAVVGLGLAALGALGALAFGRWLGLIAVAAFIFVTYQAAREIQRDLAGRRA